MGKVILAVAAVIAIGAAVGAVIKQRRNAAEHDGDTPAETGD